MKLRASLATLIFLILVVGDQIIKYLVKTGMSLGERIHVTDWFYILFTENHGMAFGMDFIGTAVLSVFRVAAMILREKNVEPVGHVNALAQTHTGFDEIFDDLVTDNEN